MSSFGTMRDFARASNYSPYYYRRTASALALAVLGRTQARQGRPALRCTEDFLACAKMHAAATSPHWDTFTIGQNFELVTSWNFKQRTDFVRFEIIDNLSFTAIGYQIGGYWLIDRQIIEFGADGEA